MGWGTAWINAQMEWARIAPYFVWDGSLRDVYILDTALSDWSGVWGYLMTEPSLLTFFVDGDAVPPPATVEEAFALQTLHGVTASYALGKQRLNCHFFLKEEIEFDLDPRDVDGPEAANQLTLFMAALGRITGKEVLLTEEGMRQLAIARFVPAEDQVIWTSFDGEGSMGSSASPS